MLRALIRLPLGLLAALVILVYGTALVLAVAVRFGWSVCVQESLREAAEQLSAARRRAGF